MAPADGISFDPDSKGLEAYLKGRDVRELLGERAKVGMRHARAKAPVSKGRRGRPGGRYKASFQAYDAGNDLRDGSRAEVHLIANIDYGAAQEWGTPPTRRQGGSNKALHTLRSVIDAIERGL